MDSRRRTPNLERDRVSGNLGSSSLGGSTLAAFNATDTRQIRVRSRSLMRATGCCTVTSRICYIG